MDLAGVPVYEVPEAECDLHLAVPNEAVNARRPIHTKMCAHHITVMRAMIEQVNAEKEAGRGN